MSEFSADPNNPVEVLAFRLSELFNDNAPIGWRRYIGGAGILHTEFVAANARADVEYARGLEDAAKIAEARDLSIMSSTIVDVEARKIAAAIRALKNKEKKPRAAETWVNPDDHEEAP